MVEELEVLANGQLIHVVFVKAGSAVDGLVWAQKIAVQHRHVRDAAVWVCRLVVIEIGSISGVTDRNGLFTGKVERDELDAMARDLQRDVE